RGEVAVARQAASPGGELRARPQGHERGRVSRILPARGRHRAARDGLRAPGAAASLRSGESQAAAGRGLLPDRDGSLRGRGHSEVIPGVPTVADAALNSLNGAGLRVRMRPMERAAFYAAWKDKQLHGLFLVAVGNSGNAATRAETFMYSKGAYAHGGYPDIDDLFIQQSKERDVKKREALLYKIQQL